MSVLVASAGGVGLTGAGAALAAPDVAAPELAAPLAGADGEAGVDPRGRDSMAFESIDPLRTGAD
jgi:hypothetical protein